ncbi:hypothetical protein [Aeromonas aquatica]|uniref:hypothetical protein n=1 Tax=Aeromonas aquatica TaxID=558964 RepID=UPI00286F1FE8|nr:hypothetical protein [Aeromonas aquatica]
MRRIYFNQITIISKIAKKAAQFNFSKSYNLILSEQKNSVGKSSLVKNIFWCLGCEPQFDDKWKALDCRVILNFDVKGEPYQIARHGNKFILNHNGINQVFTSVGGSFSIELMKLFEFNAQLTVRDKDEIQIPPPSYYFLPFYIDQKQSWANAWQSFNNLGQFSDWKKTIISYHTGMIGKDYFDTTKEICAKKIEASAVNKEIERLDTAISVVEEFCSSSNLVIDEGMLNKVEDDLSIQLMSLHLQQEVMFEELASLRSEKAHAESQLIIANHSFIEATNDYEFSETMPEEIECPTCGVLHDNSIVNRFTLLQDKNQAKDVIARISSQLIDITEKINQKSIEFNTLREDIKSLDDKYSPEKNTEITLSSILENVASSSVKRKVEDHRCHKVVRLHNIKNDEQGLIKFRTNASKEKRQLVKQKFQEFFPLYLSKLKAFGVNSSAIKSPENHAKVAASGGAAESTRAMLAYYVSIYKLIELYGEHILCPFIIDTPNQHEQAAKHYDSIISLLLEELPSNAQLFVCGMDDHKLTPLKEIANTIYLDVEHSLLNEESFEILDTQYSSIFE